MNKEEVLTTINQFLPDLQNALEQGIAYSGDLFNRMIRFLIIEHSLYVLISLIIVMICIVYLYKVSKGYDKKKKEDEDYERTDDDINLLYLWLSIFAIALIILFTICFFSDIVAIFKLNIVPELYILEYIKQ